MMNQKDMIPQKAFSLLFKSWVPSTPQVLLAEWKA